MGNMHKEIISRKRMMALGIIFMAVVTSLYVSQLMMNLNVYGSSKGRIADIFVLAVMALVVPHQVSKCRTRYKYSIIADQFIIHKLKGQHDKVVENIKLNSIEHIEKGHALTAHVLRNKKYICSLIDRDVYCCSYREGNRTRKFYFQPSNELAQKLNRLKEKRLAS